MKKILNALFLMLLAVFTFSSCSDVPAPYDILGEGDVPGVSGDGTKENPYSIEAVQKKQDGTIAWAEGYIVGTIENYQDPSGSAKFAAPFTASNNLLIAASATETNVKNCVVVQLSSGTELLTKLNLVNNAANLGHVLAIQGSLEKFYGFPGVKSTTAATLDGKDVGDGGDPTPGGSTTITENQPYSVSFASDLAGFTVENKVSEGLTGDVWYYSKKYTAATSSSYNGTTNVPAEGWFLSPVLDMTAISKATLTFEHSSYSEGKPEELMLKVREENASNWTDLVISNYSNGRDNHVTTTIDLTAYAGKKAQIAFVYKNLAGGTNNTWYIYNLKVAAGEGGGETPGEGTELLTNGGFENWADGYPTGWKSVSTAGNATLEQSTDKRTGTYSVLVKGDTQNKRLGSAEMTLKAGTYVFSAYFKAATADKASARLGYVPIDDAGVAGNYEYDAEYVNDIANTDWVTKSYTFTLTEEKKICLVVMNSKNPGKDLLIDDASLKTEDGGIVGGGGTDPDPVGKVYTSNITLPEGTSTDANKASGGKVVVEGTEYPILKLGTSSALGFWNSPALQAGASKLSFFAVGWTGKAGQLTVVIENGGTFEGGVTSKVIALDGKTAGAAGNSPFTITPADTDFYQYTMSGVTALSTIKFTTDGAAGDKRAIIFGINIK